MKGLRSPLRTKRAFTLIELLVVIAIIAILAAILFPVFAQAREKARAITCISNQKQLGLGIMMYLEDYDECFPQNQYYDGPGFNDQHVWSDMIYPYIKNGDLSKNGAGQLVQWGTSGIYLCPDFPQPVQNAYGINWSLAMDGSNPWSNPEPVVVAAHLASVTTPAAVILLAEKGRNDASWGWPQFEPWEWSWTDYVAPVNGQQTHFGPHYDLDPTGNNPNGTRGDCDYSTSSGSPPWDSCNLFPRYRHTGTTNVTFCDGHTKAMTHGSINWYTNIYPGPTGIYPTDQSWYPY